MKTSFSRPSPGAESLVLVCCDGRGMSAAVAAAWFTMHGETLDQALEAVVSCGQAAGAVRLPLDAFGNREAFSAALSEARPARPMDPS